ncbi:uncharacterized protein CMU_005390 [Cryptosporidium muris RN66]|uniref:Uncharacterized protein n=1 Tax=Cryptosporidium muris (strain RN66) TaxID=441375 RepID=B6AHC1_CRYMR|nr:uncharacterized protein CMU_005390 [Cryptosporidium muris RN66]EEA07616.1 hypothetical protein, conserved [Cryptosporidium muris RN66]|eukprot:XP_002141965.1 hypothetical protein [Cryptosporidium muris RN66]
MSSHTSETEFELKTLKTESYDKIGQFLSTYKSVSPLNLTDETVTISSGGTLRRLSLIAMVQVISRVINIKIQNMNTCHYFSECVCNNINNFKKGRCEICKKDINFGISIKSNINVINIYPKAYLGGVIVNLNTFNVTINIDPILETPTYNRCSINSNSILVNYFLVQSNKDKPKGNLFPPIIKIPLKSEFLFKFMHSMSGSDIHVCKMTFAHFQSEESQICLVLDILCELVKIRNYICESNLSSNIKFDVKNLNNKTNDDILDTNTKTSLILQYRVNKQKIIMCDMSRTSCGSELLLDKLELVVKLENNRRKSQYCKLQTHCNTIIANSLIARYICDKESVILENIKEYLVEDDKTLQDYKIHFFRILYAKNLSSVVDINRYPYCCSIYNTVEKLWGIWRENGFYQNLNLFLLFVRFRKYLSVLNKQEINLETNDLSFSNEDHNLNERKYLKMELDSGKSSLINSMATREFPVNSPEDFENIRKNSSVTFHLEIAQITIQTIDILSLNELIPENKKCKQCYEELFGPTMTTCWDEDLINKFDDNGEDNAKVESKNSFKYIIAYGRSLQINNSSFTRCMSINVKNISYYSARTFHDAESLSFKLLTLKQLNIWQYGGFESRVINLGIEKKFQFEGKTEINDIYNYSVIKMKSMTINYPWSTHTIGFKVVETTGELSPLLIPLLMHITLCFSIDYVAYKQSTVLLTYYYNKIYPETPLFRNKVSKQDLLETLESLFINKTSDQIALNKIINWKLNLNLAPSSGKRTTWIFLMENITIRICPELTFNANYLSFKRGNEFGNFDINIQNSRLNYHYINFCLPITEASKIHLRLDIPYKGRFAYIPACLVRQLCRLLNLSDNGDIFLAAIFGDGNNLKERFDRISNGVIYFEPKRLLIEIEDTNLNPIINLIDIEKWPKMNFQIFHRLNVLYNQLFYPAPLLRLYRILSNRKEFSPLYSCVSFFEINITNFKLILFICPIRDINSDIPPNQDYQYKTSQNLKSCNYYSWDDLNIQKYNFGILKDKIVYKFGESNNYNNIQKDDIMSFIYCPILKISSNQLKIKINIHPVDKISKCNQVECFGLIHTLINKSNKEFVKLKQKVPIYIQSQILDLGIQVYKPMVFHRSNSMSTCLLSIQIPHHLVVDIKSTKFCSCSPLESKKSKYNRYNCNFNSIKSFDDKRTKSIEFENTVESDLIVQRNCFKRLNISILCKSRINLTLSSTNPTSILASYLSRLIFITDSDYKVPYLIFRQNKNSQYTTQEFSNSACNDGCTNNNVTIETKVHLSLCDCASLIILPNSDLYYIKRMEPAICLTIPDLRCSFKYSSIRNINEEIQVSKYKGEVLNDFNNNELIEFNLQFVEGVFISIVSNLYNSLTVEYKHMNKNILMDISGLSVIGSITNRNKLKFNVNIYSIDYPCLLYDYRIPELLYNNGDTCDCNYGNIQNFGDAKQFPDENIRINIRREWYKHNAPLLFNFDNEGFYKLFGIIDMFLNCSQEKDRISSCIKCSKLYYINHVNTPINLRPVKDTDSYDRTLFWDFSLSSIKNLYIKFSVNNAYTRLGIFCLIVNRINFNWIYSTQDTGTTNKEGNSTNTKYTDHKSIEIKELLLAADANPYKLSSKDTKTVNILNRTSRIHPFIEDMMYGIKGEYGDVNRTSKWDSIINITILLRISNILIESQQYYKLAISICSSRIPICNSNILYLHFMSEFVSLVLDLVTKSSMGKETSPRADFLYQIKQWKILIQLDDVRINFYSLPTIQNNQFSTRLSNTSVFSNPVKPNEINRSLLSIVEDIIFANPWLNTIAINDIEEFNQLNSNLIQIYDNEESICADCIDSYNKMLITSSKIDLLSLNFMKLSLDNVIGWAIEVDKKRFCNIRTYEKIDRIMYKLRNISSLNILSVPFSFILSCDLANSFDILDNSTKCLDIISSYDKSSSIYSHDTFVIYQVLCTIPSINLECKTEGESLDTNSISIKLTGKLWPISLYTLTPGFNHLQWISPPNKYGKINDTNNFNSIIHFAESTPVYMSTKLYYPLAGTTTIRCYMENLQFFGDSSILLTISEILSSITNFGEYKKVKDIKSSSKMSNLNPYLDHKLNTTPYNLDPLPNFRRKLSTKISLRNLLTIYTVYYKCFPFLASVLSNSSMSRKDKIEVILSRICSNSYDIDENLFELNNLSSLQSRISSINSKNLENVLREEIDTFIFKNPLYYSIIDNLSVNGINSNINNLSAQENTTKSEDCTVCGGLLSNNYKDVNTSSILTDVLNNNIYNEYSNFKVPNQIRLEFGIGEFKAELLNSKGIVFSKLTATELNAVIASNSSPSNSAVIEFDISSFLLEANKDFFSEYKNDPTSRDTKTSNTLGTNKVDLIDNINKANEYSIKDAGEHPMTFVSVVTPLNIEGHTSFGQSYLLSIRACARKITLWGATNINIMESIIAKVNPIKVNITQNLVVAYYDFFFPSNKIDKLYDSLIYIRDLKSSETIASNIVPNSGETTPLSSSSNTANIPESTINNHINNITPFCSVESNNSFVLNSAVDITFNNSGQSLPKNILYFHYMRISSILVEVTYRGAVTLNEVLLELGSFTQRGKARSFKQMVDKYMSHLRRQATRPVISYTFKQLRHSLLPKQFKSLRRNNNRNTNFKHSTSGITKPHLEDLKFRLLFGPRN